MVIVEIDSPTFPLKTLIIRGKCRRNEGLPEPVGRIAKTSGLGERDSSKFSALHEKIPHKGNARLHCL